MTTDETADPRIAELEREADAVRATIAAQDGRIRELKRDLERAQRAEDEFSERCAGIRRRMFEIRAMTTPVRVVGGEVLSGAPDEAVAEHLGLEREMADLEAERKRWLERTTTYAVDGLGRRQSYTLLAPSIGILLDRARTQRGVLSGRLAELEAAIDRAEREAAPRPGALDRLRSKLLGEPAG